MEQSAIFWKMKAINNLQTDWNWLQIYSQSYLKTVLKIGTVFSYLFTSYSFFKTHLKLALCVFYIKSFSIKKNLSFNHKAFVSISWFGIGSNAISLLLNKLYSISNFVLFVSSLSRIYARVPIDDTLKLRSLNWIIKACKQICLQLVV